MIHGVGKEQFFIQNFGHFEKLLGGNYFHPFFQGFPFSKRYEKVITTNLIESLNLIKPFLNGNELNWLGGNKLANSLATERIIIFNFVFVYLRVWHHFHVIVIVGMFPHHIDEFISC